MIEIVPFQFLDENRWEPRMPAYPLTLKLNYGNEMFWHQTDSEKVGS